MSGKRNEKGRKGIPEMEPGHKYFRKCGVLFCFVFFNFRYCITRQN